MNLLEEIEEPGEYYIDRDVGILYFLPAYPLEHFLLLTSGAEGPERR